MKIKKTATKMITALFALALSASADTVTWTGTAGDFLWATVGNWDTGTVPVLANDVVIGASASAVQIPSGLTAQAAKFTLGSNGNAVLDVVGTLTMTNSVTVSSDSLGNTATVSAHDGGLFNWTKDCTVGYRKGTGILNQSVGAVSATSLTVGSSSFGNSTRATSKGVVVSDDFDLTLSGALVIGHQYTTGYYTNRNGGSISCGSVVIARQIASGVLALESGTLTSSATLTLGDWGNSDGILVSGDGTAVSVANGITLGNQSNDSGTLDLGAMTLSLTAYGKTLTIGSIHASYYTTATGTLIMRGTTISNGSAEKIAVNPRSTITGYGAASSSSTSTLDMSGKTTATGFGQEKDLTFSGYATMAQFYAGNGTNGWYAENGGRLALPSVAIAAGNSTNNLAEVKTAATLDLVNSVQVRVNNAAAGSLSYKLYAPERSDVPSGLNLAKTVSVWQLVAPSFDSAVLTFKLPDVNAGDKLKLLRYVGGHWVVVGTVDAGTDFAMATGLVPAGDDNLGFFAVAPEVPFKGTVILVL